MILESLVWEYYATRIIQASRIMGPFQKATGFCCMGFIFLGMYAITENDGDLVRCMFSAAFFFLCMMAKVQSFESRLCPSLKPDQWMEQIDSIEIVEPITVELLELLFLSLHARDEYLLAETIARLGQSSEVSRLDLVVDIECFGLEVIRSLSKE